MSKGSVWKKWDLHIHTPASYTHEYHLTSEEAKKYKGDIWGKFIDFLEGEAEFPAIGITDYFSIEGYKKVVEYRNQGRLANFQLVLPNIEFRLDKFLTSRNDDSERRLNYHVIFSDELEPRKIENEFLRELHIEADIGEKRPLSRENLTELGKKLKEHHAEFRDRSNYYIGCMNAYVSLDEIREVLKSKDSIFKGRYLLVLADDYWSQANWDNQAHLLRRTLLIKSDALFASNPNNREWALGLVGYRSQEAFIREFGKLYPSIHGSDAHKFDDLFKPDLDRFCWIKADTTFDGLKQIVFEPEERVRIQPDSPEPRKSLYTLDSIEFSNTNINQDVALTEQIIPLNGSLVAVTGGKGSGKTALLDLIANLFENRTRSGGRDENSFVQRIEEEKPDLAVKVVFLGKDISPFAKELIDGLFFESTEITYLPQGRIEEISGTRDRMDMIIREIIFSNAKVIEAGLRKGFEVLAGELIELSNAIDEINREINKLEEETKAQIVTGAKRSKTLKEGELKDRQDELTQFATQIEDGTKANVEEIEAEETNLRKRHSRLTLLLDGYSKFERDVVKLIAEVNTQIESLNLQASEFAEVPQVPLFDTKDQIGAIKLVKKATAKLIKDVQKRIKEKERVLEKLSDEERTHAEMLKSVNELRDEIDEVESVLSELESKKIQILKWEKQRTNRYRDLIESHNKLKRHYRRVISEFSKGKTEILDGIDFHSAVYFDREEFIKLGLDILDNRKVKSEELEALADNLNETISGTSKPKRKVSLNEFAEEAMGFRPKIREIRTNYDFYRWCFNDYFSLSTDVFFKGIKLGKLSLGQKGTVLLKLFLAEGDHPLIVDQPEESLDNEFIYAELVGAIRNAKRMRQVMIATNNANLVVNTDAEQVIVAEFVNNVIEYSPGTLENPETKEAIISILEGGEEAFKKRESKYGI